MYYKPLYLEATISCKPVLERYIGECMILHYTISTMICQRICQTRIQKIKPIIEHQYLVNIIVENICEVKTLSMSVLVLKDMLKE